MPDIADQLDAAIGAAPPAVPALEETLVLGRRALRRRRMAYAVGAATTALVVGGTAWAVAPGGDAGADRVGTPVGTSPSASDLPTDRSVGSDANPDSDRSRGSDRSTATDQDGREWPGTPRDDLVRFSHPRLAAPEPGTLVPVGGTEILDQRPGADVGDSFAAPDDVTGVALVQSGGSRLFVLARVVDGGPAQYIAVAASGTISSIEEFLAFARTRYADGGGGLL